MRCRAEKDDLGRGMSDMHRVVAGERKMGKMGHTEDFMMISLIEN